MCGGNINNGACLCGWRGPQLVAKEAPKKFTGMLGLYGFNQCNQTHSVLPAHSDPYTP